MNTTRGAADAVADYLTDLGAAGVQINDPAEFKLLRDAAPADLAASDEPDACLEDSGVELKVYFSADSEKRVCVSKNISLPGQEVIDSGRECIFLDELIERINKKLKDLNQYFAAGTGCAHVREIFEDQWSENWKQYYRTLHLTERLVINPSWIDYMAGSGEIVVSLDPGSAFGTGTHESTALCAEFMDQLIKPEMQILDLGTGSGILAIIAALLGAHVTAVDIDPLAVAVARENSRINQVQIDFQTGEINDIKGQSFHLIVVNIIADVIISIMSILAAKLASDGILITSGIIKERADDVLAAAGKAGLQLVSSKERKEWVAMVFRSFHDS